MPLGAGLGAGGVVEGAIRDSDHCCSYHIPYAEKRTSLGEN